MKKNPVNWFEIPVNELDRAKKFYESVFDIELTELGMDPWKMYQFPMVDNTYGSAGTLVKANGYKPSHEGTMIYFSVGDIEETLKKVIASGGKIILPKMSIHEYGFIAHFRRQRRQQNRSSFNDMIHSTCSIQNNK